MDSSEIISISKNGGNFPSSEDLRGNDDDFPPRKDFKELMMMMNMILQVDILKTPRKMMEIFLQLVIFL